MAIYARVVVSRKVSDSKGLLMAEYKVTITETFAHRLFVEADTEEEAYAKAFELVSNVDEDVLKEENDYELDAVGYDGFWSADWVGDD